MPLGQLRKKKAPKLGGPCETRGMVGLLKLQVSMTQASNLSA
eukprot:CAMPEP_0204228590 /NCGR_PEP_ID=MMETSP0361-20130328/86560_1 /ASSEMBLY_ACC=CAM_ASM_000343 /TAXON_ID=268821 /ORGANISM="Scrippsiella Hangoei, Strain SHTV-5" /LENGTH=41 /DNA_ID= /DNA_START= /DNA_END= /DNA_ORIENTATION=